MTNAIFDQYINVQYIKYIWYILWAAAQTSNKFIRYTIPSKVIVDSAAGLPRRLPQAESDDIFKRIYTGA